MRERELERTEVAKASLQADRAESALAQLKKETSQVCCRNQFTLRVNFIDYCHITVTYTYNNLISLNQLTLCGLPYLYLSQFEFLIALLDLALASF